MDKFYLLTYKIINNYHHKTHLFQRQYLKNQNQHHQQLKLKLLLKIIIAQKNLQEIRKFNNKKVLHSLVLLNQLKNHKIMMNNKFKTSNHNLKLIKSNKIV